MRILAIGDIVGTRSIDHLKARLWDKRKEYSIDMVIANGENATDIHGISVPDAEQIFSVGVDVITLGNHTYGRRDICMLLGDSERIIRPANYPPIAPGGGYTVVNIDGYKILCINIMGTALMEPLACPFATVDRILEREKGSYDISVMDIHAEATSEKIALGRYFDGRIDIMFGTHTHVPTADEQILPNGSGYITDLGMTGPVGGVIGTDAAAVIEKMLTKMPVRFKVADGEIAAMGAIFDIDPDTHRVNSVVRVRF